MTTNRTTYPPNLPDPRCGYLLAAHVAALLTAVDREKNPDAPLLSTETVMSHVRHSRPGGRYANRPMRAPTGHIGGHAERGGGIPYWAPGERETLAKVEAELAAWRRGMVGQGVGGGPKPRADRSAGGAR